MPISTGEAGPDNVARKTAKRGRSGAAPLDFHDYRGKVERGLARLAADPETLPANRETLREFIADYIGGRGESYGRADQLLTHLAKFARGLRVEFAKAGKREVAAFIEAVNREDLGEATKEKHRQAVRQFFKWLRGTEDYPPEVAWVKLTGTKEARRLPEDLLTEEEVGKLIQACRSARDRAMVGVLYETGARVGEFLSLRVKDVAFENGGAVITFPRGKTGARRVKAIASSPHLALWLKEHPVREDRDGPLWVLRRGENGNGPAPAGYHVVRKVLQEAAKRAGIPKAVNPHALRHARSTFLAKHLTEAQMKQYLGWTQGSKMAAVYVHLSGRDTDAAIDRIYGKAPEEKPEESILKPRPCPRCKFVAPAGAQFCPECAAPLDIKAMLATMEEMSGGAGETAQAAKRDAEMANFMGHLIRSRVLDELYDRWKSREGEKA